MTTREAWLDLVEALQSALSLARGRDLDNLRHIQRDLDFATRALTILADTAADIEYGE